MNYFDAEVLQKALTGSADFSAMISRMQAEVDKFFPSFDDSPDRLSGWGHRYFCEKDGGRLIYNPETPREHRCEICGEVYSNDVYNAVGVYNYRNMAVLNVWISALLYKVLKKQVYLDYVINTVRFYAENYLKFQLHNKEGHVYNDLSEMEWGCGRIMPQGLNECIFVIRMINGLEIVKDDLDPGFLSMVHKKFFTEVFALLKPQCNKIHNIICWYNCAIGTMGLFSNDPEMTGFAFNGPFNARRQIAEGVTRDNFWYEGSIHYNFFTLEGIVNLLLFAGVYNQPLVQEEKVVAEMLKAAYNYAFDNHTLPNPNDGWPNINLKTYSYIYTIASKFLGYESETANLLKNIENKPVVRETVPLSRPYYYDNRIPLERLVLIPDMDFTSYREVKPEARNFSASHFAIIRRDGINVFLKYGHNGPSHAHPDKMNIEVMWGDRLLTKDLSNSGYGVKLCDEWQRTTASHNTVVMDGMNQISMRGGEVEIFRPDRIRAITRDVYSIDADTDINKMKTSMNEDELIKYMVRNLHLSKPEALEAIRSGRDLQSLIGEIIHRSNKVDYIRNISIEENGFLDQFEVRAENPGVFDYFFHSHARLVNPPDVSEASLEYTSNGYQHIKNIRKVKSAGEQIVLEWQLGQRNIRSAIDMKDKELFIADTYDNPITQFRTAFVIRYRGTGTLFRVRWEG